MDNIIQDFSENFIRHIEKYVDNLFEDEKKGISELIEIMQQNMDKLGRKTLVYVHEGRQGDRNKLKNAKFFSGSYNKSEDLWEEVLSYIDDSYDMDHIETIFLASGLKSQQKNYNNLPPIVDLIRFANSYLIYKKYFNAS
jgi:hypothetical protein